jgi:hypothetical protein
MRRARVLTGSKPLFSGTCSDFWRLREGCFSGLVGITAWTDVIDEQNLNLPVFLWLEDAERRVQGS